MEDIPYTYWLIIPHPMHDIELIHGHPITYPTNDELEKNIWVLEPHE